MSLWASSAECQEPDIREIRPAVMLLLDSSGSMNYDLRSPISLASGFGPTCTGNVGPTNTRNRWIALVEALTGTFDGYYCTSINRRTYRGAADQFYFMPHYAPSGSQMTNGLLDAYRDRVKFGMMTLDPVYGIMGGSGALEYLVPSAIYRARSNDITGALGEYSYGSGRPISFPGCTEPYLVNGGSRRAARAGETILGGLVSVGSDSSDYLTTNAQVQSALLSIRPYGGSSLDALVQDFEEWVTTDNDVSRGSDPLAACRDRYAILVSDGQGDNIYQRMGCNSRGHVCPYDLASTTVRRMCAYNGSECTGVIDGFYTVGFSVSGASDRAWLDDLASVGGTVSSYSAESADDLLRALSSVLDRAATGTTTRTTTAYINNGSTYTGSGAAAEYEFTSGFRVGTTRTPWTGVLDRTRYVCTGARTPPARATLDPNQDSFHVILNNRDLIAAPRRLLTVVSSNPDDSRGVFIGDIDPLLEITRSGTGSTRVTYGADFVPITVARPEVTSSHLGFTTGSPMTRAASRAAIIDWLHGVTRPGARLGDIYHSSPQIQSVPRADIADEWFNMWRRRPDIVDRPSVVYVGTNDGVLHAFSAESHTMIDGTVIPSGSELWGFVPPAVLPLLRSASVSHQALVDGTPIVRHLFFRRAPGEIPNSSSYHTVLVMGLRGGGPHYFALDVTDPLEPQFMWQFTRSDMGPAVGRPALGQVLVSLEGTLQQRAIAVFGGGGGTLAAAPRGRGWGGCSVPPGALQARFPASASGRTTRNCWITGQGQSLYVVDVATGEVLRRFGSETLSAPMTGGVSLFTGETGTIATRAYTTDSDGVLWRLDMSSRNISQWTLMPVHDLYWSDVPEDGADSQDPPIISVDNSGNVVIVVGTGDMDDLEGQDLYRVASVTDTVRYSSTGAISFDPSLNWEIRLRPGEQVTGPMTLFESRVYFSTFASASDSTDLCEFGGSRLWGVHYLQTTSTAPADYTGTGFRFPAAGLEAVSGSSVFDRHYVDIASNSIAVGVSVGVSPTCVSGTSLPDPYLGSRFVVNEAAVPTFRLVSQVSGGSSVSTGVTSVPTTSVSLPTPNAFTRIMSWASNADY